MTRIGIMQGRLSPPSRGRIQAFPLATWCREFDLAREAGLDCIEWVYEADTEADNPLRADEGIARVTEAVRATGVAVSSVCADYYMEIRLVRPDGEPARDAVTHLEWLLERAAAVGARHIVLPFVDAASLVSDAEVEGAARALDAVMPAAERAGVELHLETDLAPDRFRALLDRVPHPLVRATYDIGNSASLGRAPGAELPVLGPRLGSVHVKDRVRGGGTVPLGTGSADFDACFRLLRAIGYARSYILQAARHDGESEVELAKRNRRFVEHHLAAAAAAAV